MGAEMTCPPERTSMPVVALDPLIVNVLVPAMVYPGPLSKTRCPTVLGASSVIVRGAVIAPVRRTSAPTAFGDPPSQLLLVDQDPLLSTAQVGSGVSKNACEAPAIVPVPTICAPELIPVAVVSVHPLPAGMRLFKSFIPTPPQINA